jgi:hypothetical protein
MSITKEEMQAFKNVSLGIVDAITKVVYLHASVLENYKHNGKRVAEYLEECEEINEYYFNEESKYDEDCVSWYKTEHFCGETNYLYSSCPLSYLTMEESELSDIFHKEFQNILDSKIENEKKSKILKEEMALAKANDEEKAAKAQYLELQKRFENKG